MADAHEVEQGEVNPPPGWSTEEWLAFLEQGLRRLEIGSVARRESGFVVRPHIALKPPGGWRHPVTGRKELEPDPALVLFGQYLRRSRYFAHMSQQYLADLSGVNQSQISRAERGLAPAMAAERLVRLAAALGRAFPLGSCPHEHDCAWQPLADRAVTTGVIERWLERLTRPPVASVPELAGDQNDPASPISPFTQDE